MKTSDSLKNKVLQAILSNLQSAEKRRLGVEVETIFYDQKLRRIPVNKGKRYSASDLMDDLSQFQKKEENPCTYSLEPGGQLEWASSPFVSLHETNSQLQTHTGFLDKLCSEHSLIPLDLSMEPIFEPSEIELIDLKKYHLMNERFQSTGSHGSWMMRNSASVQVNIDLTDKNDGAEMAFVADCLQPFCSFLFSHSPFIKGRNAGKNNLRIQIWNDTDCTRCGHLIDHGLYQSQSLIESYVEYILGVPAIFILGSNSEVKDYNGLLGDWLNSLNNQGRLSSEYIHSALHQIFTHVRFKHVLEVRGADRPPFGFELAPAAFWCGLLTAEKVRKNLLTMVTAWSKEERASLNKSAETLELTQAGPEGKTCEKWIHILSDYAIRGLDERADFLGIKSERIFLEPFLEQSLEKLWTLKIQNSLKKSGQNINSFLRNAYTR